MADDLPPLVVQLIGDTSDLFSKLDETDERLRSFSTGSYTGTLDLADDKAKLTLDDLNARLAAFGTEDVGPSVDLGGVEETNARLAEISGKLDVLGQKTARPKVDVDTSSAESSISGLMTAIIGLGPALIPVAAELTAGIAAIGPMLLAAGAGFGAFGLAAAGSLSQVTSVAEITLANFQKLAAPEVLPVIQEAMRLIIPLFSTLMPLVDATSTELLHLEGAAQSALSAPFWRGFITFIDSEAGPSINAFGSLVGGLVKVFAGVSQAMAPVISDIETGLTSVGQHLSEFGENAANGGLQSFLNYVIGEAPTVGQFLQNLVGVIEKLLVALAPIGAVVLQVVTSLTQFLNIVLGFSSPVDTVALAIIGLGIAYSKLNGPVSAAIGAIKGFRDAVAASGTAEAAGGLEGSMAGIVAGLGGIAAVAPVALGAVAIGAGIFVIAKASADNFNGSVQKLVGNVEQLPTKTLPQLSVAIAATTKQLQNAKQATDEAAKSWGSLNAFYSVQHEPASTAIQELTTYLQTLRKEEDQQNNNLGFLQQNFGLSRQAAEQLAQSLNVNLSKAMTPQVIDQFNAALQQQAAQAGLTASALAEMASKAGISTSQMTTDITNATSATQSAWNSLGNAVTQFSSATLPPTAAAITQFYAESELQGAQFSQNIQTAIKDGYDPRLISQILQAGPQQAGQLLQGLVNAQGGALTQMVTQSLSAMASEGAQAVEEARVTQEAVESHSSTMAAQLSSALAIDQALTTSNAAQSVATLAQTMNGGLPQLEQIANEYGIALPNSLKAQASNILGGSAANAQAVSAAMRANQSDTNAAALAAANALPVAVQGAYGAAALAGGGLMSNVAGGVTLEQGLLASAANTAATNAAPSFVTGVNWSLIGQQIDSGVAGGIAGGTGLMGIAMRAAAGQTLLAGQQAVGAHSPSTLARDLIGLPIAQGVALGISNNAHLATNAATNMMNGVLRGATGSLGLSVSGGVTPLSAGSAGGGTTTILQVTTPLQVNGQTLASTVTQYQLRQGRAVGNILGGYAGGTQTQSATQLNTNAVPR